MIKARHQLFVYSFFKMYTLAKMKTNFNSVKVNGVIDVTDHSVLLIANHISWWDGFWALYLSMKVFRKKYHFMMLEKELRKRWLFSFSGGFSIAQGAKSVIDSLNYSAELLKDKNNLVLMFPQGKLHSMHDDNFRFQKGVERILSKTQNTKVVFLASIIDYFEHPKPDVNFYIKEYNSEHQSFTDIESAYRKFYKNSVEHQKQNIL